MSYFLLCACQWVYLTSNQYQIPSIAFLGDDDSSYVEDILQQHTDYDKLYEKELAEKLRSFYTSLMWGSIPTDVNQKAQDFFAF